MNDRHTEFFGPDLARGPFTSSAVETAAMQLGALLGQLRAPLTRSDADIQAHADFIRELADRLAPDWASQIRSDVGTYDLAQIRTSIRVPNGANSLLHCWLTDSFGGVETTFAPDLVTWNSGLVLEEITPLKRWLIVTPTTGVADVTVLTGSTKRWRWAIARHGRVHYSRELIFP